MKLGPRPTGRPWTPAEDEQLLALLDSRMDQHLIAHRLKRTVQAVRPRKYVFAPYRFLRRVTGGCRRDRANRTDTAAQACRHRSDPKINPPDTVAPTTNSRVTPPP